MANPIQEQPTELTPEQKDLIPVVRDEWLKRFFDPEPPDLLKILDAVNWLYSLAKEKPPWVVIVESPFAAQLVANWISCLNDSDAEESIRALPKKTKTLGRRDMLLHIKRDIPLPPEAKPYKQFTQLPGIQIAWSAICQAIEQKIKNLYEIGRGVPLDIERFHPGVYVSPVDETPSTATVFDKCVKQIIAKNLTYTDFSYHFNCMDYHWVAFYDFFTRIGIINHQKFNDYLQHLKCGVYESIQLKGVCIVSLMPQFIKRDENDRLHSLDGPAIQWYDGYKFHYINGVYFEPKLYQRIVGNYITAKELLQMENLEQKAIALKIFGYHRMISETSSRILDIHLVDINGKEATYELIDADLNDHPKPARFVKVVCYSTGKETLLRVDPSNPQCNTALGAVAWTAQMSTDEYVLDMET